MKELKSSKYDPRPIDLADIKLPQELCGLVESLAENVHNTWARSRLDAGWSWGHERSDGLKTNPCLIPYAELPDAEKSYDRNTALATVKAILKLGFVIIKMPGG